MLLMEKANMVVSDMELDDQNEDESGPRSTIKGTRYTPQDRQIRSLAFV